MRLLVVEDTADLADAILAHFSAIGHACDRAASCEDAMELLSLETYDAVILDINLPDGSGLDVLKSVRRSRNAVPILVLTARLAVDDRINAFDIGADDYLMKPFDFRELEARIRALTRRTGGETGAVISAGNLVFNAATRTVEILGQPCELTRREQMLLEILLQNRGRVLAKEELHGKLFSMDEDVGLNAVEVYVARLRRKISGSGFDIKTLRGIGYQARVTAHG